MDATRPRTRRSIKIRVFWIITFFGCILTVVFALIIAAIVVRSTSAQVAQVLRLETSRTNVRMDEYFGKAFQVLELGAEHPALPAATGSPSATRFAPTRENRDHLAAELDRLRRTFDFLYMYFGVEEDGTLIIADYDEPEDFDARVRPWYELAQERGGGVTEPYLDAATEVWVASVARPVYDNDRLNGVLAIDLSLEAVATMLFAGSEHFPSLRNLIVSPEGTVLIAADERLLGKTFPLAGGERSATTGDGTAGAEVLGSGDDGGMRMVTFDDAEHLASIYPNALTGFVLVSTIDPAEISGPAVRILLLLLAIVAAILAAYIVVMNRIVTEMITTPIMDIAEDMKRIESLDLDDTIHPTSRTYEIHLMQQSIEMMKRSLRSFRRYVPSDVVALLVRRHAEATLGAEKRELSLFFSDIAGFTSISETYDPDTLAEYLGEYFQGVTAVLQQNQGTVDKFIGDAIMAFWGAPLEVVDHAKLACRSALECQNFLSAARSEGRLPGFYTRIGINTGEAVVGNIGYEQRMSYTAIGDSVNVASRFEGLNKYYGTSIVVTGATRRAAGEEFLFRELDTVVVKGKRVGHTVYELVGFRDRLTPAQLMWYARFDEAMAAYHRRNWEEVVEILRTIRPRRELDTPLEILLKRTTGFLDNPPPEGWKGEVYLRGK